MFDLLKKKLSGFVQGIAGKKEGGAAPERKAEPSAAKEEGPVFEEERVVANIPERKEIHIEKKEAPAPKKEALQMKKEAKGPGEAVKERAPPAEKPPGLKKEESGPAPAKEGSSEPKEERKHAPPKMEKRKVEAGKAAEREPERLEKKVRKDIFAAVKETISGASEIREGEISELLEELELGLIESDVALEVADWIKAELKKRVVGAKVPKGKTAEFIREQLRETLVGIVGAGKGFSIPEKVRGSEKPVRIMVLGPNGSGKTTTIAKILWMLKKEGLSAVVAASDTFRAAAMEQLKHHGDKLGVKVISGAYGSDPTALAFDAVEYAKAHGIDVVLIDTAGRQDTNINLLNQLKKMNRVIAPQLKIYVGESIAGNAIVEQISAFHREIGMDGVVLTKLDCDAKGGTVVSISKVTGIPIIYVGTGQGYEDLEPFDAKRIIGEILS